MKWDFAIGNPVYQDQTLGDNKGFAPPIYDKFIDAACEIADKVEMIHPARFLFNAGATLKAWNEKMLKDAYLKVPFYEPDSDKVFPGLSTPIKGGIAIMYRNDKVECGAIKAFTQFQELNTIMLRVTESSDFISLSEVIYSRTSYRLTDKMHQENPWAIFRLSDDHAHDMSSNIITLLPEIFFDEKPNDGNEYVRILGRDENQRVREEYYVHRRLLHERDSTNAGQRSRTAGTHSVLH